QLLARGDPCRREMNPTPFQIAVPHSEIKDLKRRIRETRWPTSVPGAGWSMGLDRCGDRSRHCWPPTSVRLPQDCYEDQERSIPAELVLTEKDALTAFLRDASRAMTGRTCSRELASHVSSSPRIHRAIKL